MLSVLVVAIAGVWFWQMRRAPMEKSAALTGTQIGWCAACKRDFSMSAADATSIAKQGDKLQCPMCKKFEAKWGMAPDPPEGGSGVMMP